MDTSSRTIASVRILGTVLTGLGAIGTLLLMVVSIKPLLAVFHSQGPESGLLTLLGVLAYALVGLFTVATGLGLRQTKRWAWYSATGLSVFYLSAFPLGTTVGLYGLWALLSKGGRQLFKSPKAHMTGPLSGA